MTKPLIYTYTTPFRRWVKNIDLSTGFEVGYTGESLGKFLAVFCDDQACYSYFLSQTNQIIEFEHYSDNIIEHNIFISEDVVHCGVSGESLSINRLNHIYVKAHKLSLERWGANVSGWNWFPLIVMFVNFDMPSLLDWHCEVVSGRATLQPGEFLPMAALKKGPLLREALLPPDSGVLKVELTEEVDSACDMELF